MSEHEVLATELRGVPLFQIYDYNLALNNRAADAIEALEARLHESTMAAEAEACGTCGGKGKVAPVHRPKGGR